MALDQNKYIKKKAWFMLGLLSLCVLLSPVELRAQSDVTNRLNRMENELQTLNRAVYRGDARAPLAGAGAPDLAAQASAEVRVQQLEGELRAVRGALEEQGYKIRQLTEKLDKALSDVQLRMDDLEKMPKVSEKTNDNSVQTFTWNSSEPSKNKPIANKKPAPLKALTSGQAATSYENAFAFLKNEQYEQAEKGFKSFIQNFPKHALLGNAKYWLGETYYVRGNYDVAAKVFAEGYKQFPNGSKAPDNLLKLGMSLAGMGSVKDACTAFMQVKDVFSAGAAPVLRRAEQEINRLNCAS